jgi:hypothetical protein
MCILFLFVYKTRAWTISNANQMLKIVLCLGYLFIFLEYLHAQTSPTFIRDKCIFAGIIGITPCIAIFVLSFKIDYYHMNIYSDLPYILYSLLIFIFSLLGKEHITSLLLKYYFIAIPFLLLLGLLAIRISIGTRLPYEINYLSLKLFIIFCCTQLIPLQYKKLPFNAISAPLLNPIKKWMIMLFFRLLYFSMIAGYMAIVWMRGWY